MSSHREQEAAASASVPLHQLLNATAAALQAIGAGQSGTAALEATDAALRPAVQALLFQVLRNLGRAQALRRLLAPRKPQPRVDALLCTALAFAWAPQASPYEPFTLVNQAVEAAKRNPATRGSAAFVNACLRRFLREQAALVSASDDDEVAVWNHPAWWIKRLRQDHPRNWQQILQANNAPAPMVLRVSRQKTTQSLYQKALQAINIESSAVGDWGLVLERPVPVQRLPGFDQGLVSVQDAAAQMAAPLLLGGLDAARPLRLLDACAAPGGKTAQLLEWAAALRASWQVTALEVDEQRSQRIHDNLRRLDLRAEVLVADAGAPEAWWQQASGGALFDGILLDAPCTASGIVRRHPDVRWLRRESDVEKLAALQARLLAALWPLLAPGGRMLYCTCSVFRAEGDGQIQAFLAHNTDAQLLPSPGHLFPGGADKRDALQDNGPGEHDGFFYALLQKAARAADAPPVAP